MVPLACAMSSMQRAERGLFEGETKGVALPSESIEARQKRAEIDRIIKNE